MARARTKKPAKKKDALTRAIEAKERSIARGARRIAAIRDEAAQAVALVRKQMALNRVLLDALKRGSLKP